MARKQLSATEARNLRTLLLLNVFAAEEIGARIKEAREQAGMDQRDLADLIGLSIRQLQNLEYGASKPYKHLKEIADATNRPFGWFLHGDEDVPTELPQGLAEQLADAMDGLASVVARFESIAARLEALPGAQAPARSGRKTEPAAKPPR